MINPDKNCLLSSYIKDKQNQIFKIIGESKDNNGKTIILFLRSNKTLQDKKIYPNDFEYYFEVKQNGSS